MSRRWIAIAVSLLLTLLLSVGGAAAQDPEPGREAEPQADAAVTATVASQINYQGVLKESGAPVTGSRDMVFRLYSDSSCTALVDTFNVAGVTVEEGLFYVTLGVAHSDFNGQGLWLDVDVSGTPIVDCQGITPVPYALSLRPGARTADTGSDVRLNYRSATGVPPLQFTYKYGVRSEVSGSYTYGYGLYGRSSAGAMGSYGVYGRSDSDVGVGVYGQGAKGVFGYADDDAGAGVYAANSSGSGADLMLGGETGRIHAYSGSTDSDILIHSNDNVEIKLDSDGSGEDADFYVRDKDDNVLLNVDEDGWTTVQVLQISGGSDLAEPFEIAGEEAIEPGLAVVIDTEHPGQLRVADRAYDRTVAGCVSGANGVKPGITMQQEGSEAEGSIPVALSGRVYCWADASYGPIEPGDLLTTSDTPGHVMGVTDHGQAMGAIIGKSMGALGEGRGLILVLVSLQ